MEMHIKNIALGKLLLYIVIFLAFILAVVWLGLLVVDKVSDLSFKSEQIKIIQDPCGACVELREQQIKNNVVIDLAKFNITT